MKREKKKENTDKNEKPRKTYQEALKEVQITKNEKTKEERQH